MAEERTAAPHPGERALVTAAEGSGPLFQRDYWAVIRNARLKPSEIVSLAASRFAEFAPESLCRFQRADGAETVLDLGDELEIDITGAGQCAVRVTQRDLQSFTLSTLEGHPEAGRITFGAYRNGRGDVIFHIRSRARSGSQVKYLGFLLAGEPMQTQTWTDFVNTVANTVGEGVIGSVQADKQRVEDVPGSDRPEQPTYAAEGD